MTPEGFEKAVKDSISELPEEFQTALDNVEIVIEDGTGEFLGLYHGVPKTERTYALSLPDKITIYKNVILSVSDDPDIIKQIIKETVLHEIGHHFGLSDEELERIENTN